MIRIGLLTVFILTLCNHDSHAEFTAGSSLTNITPNTLPVLVNGGVTSRSIDVVKSPIHARSLAFSDGETTLVIVVADSCMMPRDLLDRAKSIASEKSGIPTNHILISATHTHTAPSCMGALGTDADPVYSLFLTKKLVEAVLAPLEKMEPAQIGWGSINAADYTALRRWVIHPDHMQLDPFGDRTVRANMHAATKWDQVIGKTGPEDPMLTMISVQTAKGEPLGLLANFSMHYFGDRDISPDYFGLFSDGLKAEVAPDDDRFVAMMSHDCSGDIWRHDYEKSADRKSQSWSIEEYTEGMIGLALTAMEEIEYETPESIAMAETRMTLDYRVPGPERLEWAKGVVEEMGDRPLKTKPEVYAREQIILHELQNTEIVVQGLRLGDRIAIATTPNETYAISGLKIKNASPAPHTMVIELANGGDGYIAPPEQHLLGGYNTWPARSAGLEVTAEPRIVEAAVELLEKVTARPRTDRRPRHGPAARHLLSLSPVAYWRLDEFSGPRAIDCSPNHRDGILEPQTLFHLPGPKSDSFSLGGENRSVHLVGSRLSARLPEVNQNDYTASFWFWSGSPELSIGAVEWLFSRRSPGGSLVQGDHVALHDHDDGNRYLALLKEGSGLSFLQAGRIERWSWNQLVIARSRGAIHLSLNGEKLYVSSGSPLSSPPATDFFFGGSSALGTATFEGRLDEVAVWDRALSDDEVKELYRLSTTP
ncbi:MAG: LamG domain-containing protein [Verrucomicrobiales bacterium]|nr:LamG domain-containing protein [Verrucomicrobiales bacterium]